MSSSNGFILGASAASYYDGSGPYVDKLIYNVITQDDQQVIALQDNDIDIIGDSVDPVFLGTLMADTIIDYVTNGRNGYGYLTINTEKYPFNITAFRRAFAFALDKEAISDDVWDFVVIRQGMIHLGLLIRI